MVFYTNDTSGTSQVFGPLFVFGGVTTQIAVVCWVKRCVAAVLTPTRNSACGRPEVYHFRHLAHCVDGLTASEVSSIDKDSNDNN